MQNVAGPTHVVMATKYALAEIYTPTGLSTYRPVYQQVMVSLSGFRGEHIASTRRYEVKQYKILQYLI